MNIHFYLGGGNFQLFERGLDNFLLLVEIL